MVPLIIAAIVLGVFDSSSSSSGSGSSGPNQGGSPAGATPTTKPAGASSDWGTQLGRLLEGLGKGVGAVVDAADNN